MSALASSHAGPITDIGSYWFSPLQPVSVSAPPGYRPRQWAFQPGANLSWQPKTEDNGNPVTFEALRTLADSWDILRIALDQKKNQICAVPFELRAKQVSDETSQQYKQRVKEDKTLRDLKKFFEKPDGQHRWKPWLRMWIEDMLVIDAVALYLARDKDGKIATINPIAGDTINRMLTDRGITPAPPDTAYQQVVYGTPTWNFTTDDMLYAMSNERTHKRYGFSYVERILLTISLGLRRQEWQISEYTSGNVPEALVFLPPTLTIPQVKEVQDWFDSMMAGDTAQRRKMRFLPGYGSDSAARPNVIFPKEPLLKDELDTWLAQVVCACLGISAQPFLKMMNRASAEESNDAAVQQGLKADIDFVTDVVNDLLDRMGYGDRYECAAQPHRDVDPLKQAQADNLLVGKVFTINEVRKVRGMDPDPSENANKLGMFSPVNGFIPLDTPPPDQQPKPESKNDKTPEGDEPPLPNNEPPSPKKKVATSKLEKSGHLQIDPATDPEAQQLEDALESDVSQMLSDIRDQLLAVIPGDLRKDDSDTMTAEQRRKLLNTVNSYDVDQSFIHRAENHLSTAAVNGVRNGFRQFTGALTAGIGTEQKLIGTEQKLARLHAADRAAEIVGMKWVDGELVPNPNARWNIDETTRQELRDELERAFSEETKLTDLVERIKNAGAFSQSRAKTIAVTEIRRSQTGGNLAVWKRLGIVQTVKWATSALGCCDICEANEAHGEVPLGDPFPSGDEAPPGHPNCRCVLTAVKVRGFGAVAA